MKSSGAISVSIAEKAGRPWWLWLHVLSLDAVVVALAGQEAFAHVAGVSLGAADRLLLGLCAWLAYCGDRLLDGRRIKTEAAMARHRGLRLDPPSIQQPVSAISQPCTQPQQQAVRGSQ